MAKSAERHYTHMAEKHLL